MNVSPQSENLGNTVNIRGTRASGSVKLQPKHDQRSGMGDSDDEEDEDFMALMNESKKKETAGLPEPFEGTAGLPGSFASRNGGDFQYPETSNIGERPHEHSYDIPHERTYEHPPPPPQTTSFSNTGNFRSLEEEKQHFLYKIQRLQNRFPGRRVGIETPLDELKYEYDRILRQSELSASVKFQRRTLMATVSGIEYLNKSFNPLGLHLDGWSEQVMDSLEDFDQSFEQLHDKYQGTAEVSPEWNILITLLGSGFMFHLSNSLFKSVLPNVNDVARNNPDLMNQIASAMGSAMNSQSTTPAPQGGTTNNSQLGAALAMQAMQKKLSPSAREDDDFTESVLDSENLPKGFDQAAALRKPLPPMARPVPQQVPDDFSEEGSVSDLSSEFSMSEDGSDIRRISNSATKRAAPTPKQKSKKNKNSVSINL